MRFTCFKRLLKAHLSETAVRSDFLIFMRSLSYLFLSTRRCRWQDGGYFFYFSITVITLHLLLFLLQHAPHLKRSYFDVTTDIIYSPPPADSLMTTPAILPTFIRPFSPCPREGGMGLFFLRGWDVEWTAAQSGYKMAGGRTRRRAGTTLRQLGYVSRRITIARHSDECVRNKLDSRVSPEATGRGSCDSDTATVCKH